MVADTANVSGDFSGPMVTDDLDIADELSAISMTENYHQMLEELVSLWNETFTKFYCLKLAQKRAKVIKNTINRKFR